MNFNNDIPVKLAKFIENQVARINKFNHTHFVEIKSWSVLPIQEEKTLENLINSHGSDTFDIEYLFVSHNKRTKESLSFTATLTVPRMREHFFIIDGKIRVPSTNLSRGTICRIFPGNICIRPGLKIFYGKDGISYCISFDDPDGGYINKEISDLSKIEMYKEKLMMTDEEKKRWMIKLDLEDLGVDWYSPEFVKRLIKFGPDTDLDLFIDKTIKTVSDAVIDSLMYTEQKVNSQTTRVIRSTFVKTMGTMLTKTGKFNLTAISRNILKSIGSADNEETNVPMKVNPLLVDALSSKISMDENIAYNYTMTDIIDPACTPISANVNKINEINNCADIRDGEVYIKYYDLTTGKRIESLYYDYLCQKVWANDCVDYKKMTLKPGLDEYYYKLHGKRRLAKQDEIAEIKFAEPMPDEKLGPKSRQTPFINMSDSVRIAMGTNMSQQAIELADPEPCLICTGHDDDSDKSDYIERFEQGDYAEVKDVKPDHIDLVIDGRNTQAYMKPEPISGMYNTVTSFVPLVKPGDKLKRGDALYSPKIMRNRSYDLGKNTLVFYMSYLGYTFEDGIVVSESYAKKMAHWELITVKMKLFNEDRLKDIIPIGSRVSLQDHIVTAETQMGKRSNLTGIFITDKQEKYLDCPNNVDEAYVTDINVTWAVKHPVIDDVTKVVLKRIETERSHDWDNVPDEYKVNKAVCVKEEFRGEEVAIVTVNLVRYNPIKVGAKCCNRWGSKGIISLILPDDQMPYRDSDHAICDMILNPAAVVGRKNPSQLYECALTKLIKWIYAQVDVMIKEGGNDLSKVRNFLRKYYEDKFDNMSDTEIIENHSKGFMGYRMAVGAYSRVDHDTVFNWMKEAGLSERDYVTSPVLGPIEEPVITGDSYIYKLYHSGDYSGKVSISGLQRGEPLMGRGHYRKGGGQAIGEINNSSLEHTAMCV